MSVTQEEFRQLDLEIDEIRKAFEALKDSVATKDYLEGYLRTFVMLYGFKIKEDKAGGGEND